MAISGGGVVSASPSVGGSGGAGGSGSTASATFRGNIVTGANYSAKQGDYSPGITVTSVGGGGGSGGSSISGAAAGGVSISVAVGGSGGAGGPASSASADVEGNITTAGQFSPGLRVQSSGGGGGNGGSAVSGSMSVNPLASGAVAVGIGGDGVREDLQEKFLSALQTVRSLRAMTLQRIQRTLMLHNHLRFLLNQSVVAAVRVVSVPPGCESWWKRFSKCKCGYRRKRW